MARDSAPPSKTASSASSSSPRSTSSAQSTTMSPTSQPSSDPRSLIRYACVALAITLALLWAIYLVRGPLLVIYVSALFATGLTPLVETIERQRIRVITSRRLPRGAAILIIYAAVIGALAALATAVIPPMVMQLEEFWKELPRYLDLAQQKLAHWGLITAGASFNDILQQAPFGSGSAVAVVIATLWGFVGGIFGLVSILLLTFYFLVEAQDVFSLFVRLFSAIPAVGVALTVSPALAIGVAAFCLGIQLVENNVLVPKVMGQTVGLNAVTVIIAL